MASRPNNKIYLDAINEIVINTETNFYGRNPLSPTGPQLFRRVLDKYDGDYRMDLMDNGRQLIYKETKEVVIINRTKDHHKVNLNGAYESAKHYSQMWRRRDIYN